MANKKNKKIKLGKKVDESYEYKAKIDFSQDLSAQISRLIKEKEINETIKEKVQELKEVVKKFPRKEKNLQYYYKIGKKLLFLEKNLFKDIAPNSIFRRIVEELPKILPNVDIKNKESKKNACRHIGVMYELAHVEKDKLPKASWDQWYEIGKFPGICKDKNLLKQILLECKKSKSSGPQLRKKIEEIRKSKPRELLKK